MHVASQISTCPWHGCLAVGLLFFLLVPYMNVLLHDWNIADCGVEELGVHVQAYIYEKVSA